MDKIYFLKYSFCVPQKKKNIQNHEKSKSLEWHERKDIIFSVRQSSPGSPPPHFVSSSAKCGIYKKILFVFINLQSHTGRANALNCFKEYFPRFNSTSNSTDIFQLNANLIFKLLWVNIDLPSILINNRLCEKSRTRIQTSLFKDWWIFKWSCAYFCYRPFLFRSGILICRPIFCALWEEFSLKREKHWHNVSFGRDTADLFKLLEPCHLSLPLWLIIHFSLMFATGKMSHIRPVQRLYTVRLYIHSHH